MRVKWPFEVSKILWYIFQSLYGMRQNLQGMYLTLRTSLHCANLQDCPWDIFNTSFFSLPLWHKPGDASVFKLSEVLSSYAQAVIASPSHYIANKIPFRTLTAPFFQCSFARKISVFCGCGGFRGWRRVAWLLQKLKLKNKYFFV